ncbi:helix-turn-helix domain-containing protein [Gaetbulibacter aestuarii]|uniref:Helix-turn-helix domain-containing protein n=1 Tax=Gaetbulibacter aestuarii TaxID=1502358 RepID=A0ABW7N402_9FLAO
MKTNKELELAWEFVNHTNRSIFLTGKAGTGKTTFLHQLKKDSLKRMVVVAPTGVAAINAKGVTIHSFFQLPFGPILPETDLNNPSGFNRRFNKTKINIIKSLDLLVIDEISMVRADVLDGIDRTLRRFRNRDQVFGGVQLLMIGDLQQLPPVIRDNEWQLLKHVYNNGFFFSSRAFQECGAVTIELKHIFRQENPEFIAILNEIRNNNLSEASTRELNKHYQPDFTPKQNSGYVALTTHNRKAQAINQRELDKLRTEPKTYAAQIDGKFPESSFPNDEALELKVGAQVMFIKNDVSPEKEYYNGKIGKITYLDPEEVVVKCPDDDFEIVVKPEIWENINYTVDAETKAISETRIGAFMQMPLRLAWAITIHKSQGLTFEKAIVDTEGAFAHGQTYVALSRCKSLEGLVLKSKVSQNQIINDLNVTSFNEETKNMLPNQEILKDSKKLFQLNLIAEIFDFYKFKYHLNRILDIYYKNASSIEGSIESPVISMKNTITEFLKISHTFNIQLKELSEKGDLPESDPNIQERFKKGVSYFNKKIETDLVKPLETLEYTSDNKAIDKDLSKNLDEIENLLKSKHFLFENLSDGFSTKKILDLRAKSVFITEKSSKKTKKTIISGTSNVHLFEALRALRNEIAQENDLIHYQVFTQKSLYAMCEMLPLNENGLLQINGMGKTRVKKYGKAILEVINNYCEENNIEKTDEESEFEVKIPIKKKKVDTKKVSLKLFKSGKSIKEIANERALNPNTIFGHLAHYIPSGEVDITSLMPQKHYDELVKIIPGKTFENLSDLKHQLDEKYSFGELRLVLNELSNF